MNSVLQLYGTRLWKWLLLLFNKQTLLDVQNKT